MKLIPLEVAHSIGDVVYLKTDLDQLPRLVAGYEVYETDMLYMLIHGSQSVSTHHAYEISAERNSLLGMGIIEDKANQ